MLAQPDDGQQVYPDAGYGEIYDSGRIRDFWSIISYYWNSAIFIGNGFLCI